MYFPHQRPLRKHSYRGILQLEWRLQVGQTNSVMAVSTQIKVQMQNKTGMANKIAMAIMLEYKFRETLNESVNFWVSATL
jgi:hypothetical protein